MYEEFKAELKGMATKKQLQEVIALEGFTQTLREFGCTDAQRVIDDIVRQAKAAINAFPGVYEDERLSLNDPAETANMFRKMFEHEYENKTVIVRHCKIGKAKGFGMYIVYKKSIFPDPKSSMSEKAKRIRAELVQAGKVDPTTGEVLSDITISSANVVVNLATGASANSKKLLAGLD